METKLKRGLTAAGIGLGGLLAGVVLAATLTAVAADDAPGAGAGQADPSRPQRPDEELLTGATADKVKAAALAKYPGPRSSDIETDSDGVYEATTCKADGTPVTVEVDKTFEVTGEEAGGFGGRGRRGPGTDDGAGSEAPPSDARLSRPARAAGCSAPASTAAPGRFWAPRSPPARPKALQ